MALLEDNVTTPPAALLKVTVQFAVALEFSDVGAQTRLLTVGGGATSEIAALREVLFRLAVTVALPSTLIVPAVAAKLAEVD